MLFEILISSRHQNRSDLTADSIKISKNQVEPKGSSDSDEFDDDDISDHDSPPPKVRAF